MRSKLPIQIQNLGFFLCLQMAHNTDPVTKALQLKPTIYNLRQQIPIIHQKRNPWYRGTPVIKMHLNINRGNRPFHIRISCPVIHQCPQNANRRQKKRKKKKHRVVSISIEFQCTVRCQGLNPYREQVYQKTTTSSHCNFLVYP